MSKQRRIQTWHTGAGAFSLGRTPCLSKKNLSVTIRNSMKIKKVVDTENRIRMNILLIFSWPQSNGLEILKFCRCGRNWAHWRPSFSRCLSQRKMLYLAQSIPMRLWHEQKWSYIIKCPKIDVRLFLDSYRIGVNFGVLHSGRRDSQSHSGISHHSI